MKKVHLARIVGFAVMALAIFGLCSFFIAFSDMGTAADSRLLSRVGTSGLGVIVVTAVLLTILTEVSLIKYWNSSA